MKQKPKKSVIFKFNQHFWTAGPNYSLFVSFRSSQYFFCTI